MDISGYGDTGDYAVMKAYDLLVQAESGLAMITGHPAGPGRVGVSACDIACGMAAHAGVLEALIERGTTGRGKGLKVSLFDGMADWMNVPLLYFEGTGHAPQRIGLAHPSICPYGMFGAADGFVQISVGSDKLWERFAGHFGLVRPEWATNPQRVRDRDAVIAAIDDAFARTDAADLLSTLAEIGVPAGKQRAGAQFDPGGGRRECACRLRRFQA